MKLPLGLGIILFIFSAPLISKERSGRIYDYNRLNSKATILVKRPGIFRMGETLSVFRDGKKQGELKVSLLFHSKILASPVSGTDFRSGDLVIEGTEETAPESVPEPKKARLSYVSLAAGAGWITNFECDSEGKKSEPQLRKLEFPQKIAYRTAESSFYDSIPTESVKEILFLWDGSNLSSYSIRPTKGEEIRSPEILLSQVAKKLKAPKDSIPGKTICKVQPKERRSPLEASPDALNLKIIADGVYPHGSQGKTYLLKVYSNSLFIEAFKIPVQNDSKEYTLGIGVQDLFPGKNTIQVFWVESDSNGEEIFSGSAPSLMDTFEISVGENTGYEKIRKLTSKGILLEP
ncbi:hypothetical protein CH371_14975 [Leptospira wolffii]|uniref:Uncharacterized protein n=1 Tax=Leptospira wolffii TaxID=409998 RepID=A0A2M9ZA01_9LEPT|nr:hypothetical protein [Leptospira wolffii]PJZ65214.1 hypothetical protein CH371_14975 [Leptospira wolffii]